MDYKVLGVVGGFNDDGGKPSKVGAAIVESYATKLLNGGYFSDLEKLLEEIQNYDVVIWFADVPNDKEKIVDKIKAMNPHCILVTSKRNDGFKYNIQELIQRCLKTHSHLLVEFRKVDSEFYCARVIDALGNDFNGDTFDMEKLGKTIFTRIEQLNSFHRVGSKSIGLHEPIIVDPEYLEIIHQHSLQFHQKVYGDAPIDRFLGNAAFRCPKGFPSFRGYKEDIYVTRRNIDKSMLDSSGFVEVRASSFTMEDARAIIGGTDGSKSVEYCGNFKPSVDTPIQLALYDYYKNARYMIHSHVYVDQYEPIVVAGTRYKEVADYVVPCGAIEEIFNVIYQHPSRDDCNFAVNLKGHGFIVIANSLDYMRQIVYKSRGFPELQYI